MPQSGIVKYNVKLSFEVDGLVERSDLIGAIFGQTEGLLSPEMNLNELQRVSKVGRIEVKSKSTTTKTGGIVTIPMSTDIDTCSLIAAAIEGIDKVGPFDCAFKMESIDDVRAAKKEDIVKRAQEIKRRWKTKAISEGDTMLKHVHEGNTGRVKSYGPAGIPCGSGAESSPWIILVEGRADIINLLRAGFDNAIAIQGTRIDRSVVELCRKKDKVVAFLDGDRAGGQILRELKATVNVTVALQADPGIEVEELTPDRICEILEPVAKKMNKEAEAPRAASSEDKPLADLAAKIFPNLHESLEAAALDAEKNEVFRTPISELVTRLSGQSGIKYLVLDGIITQKLFEEAKAAGIEYILGHRIARVSDHKGVTLRTFSELGVA